MASLSLSLTSSLSIASPIAKRSDFLSPPLALPCRISSPPSKWGRGRLTITCVRVGGVEIPNEKRLEFSLQSIYGIGRTISRVIINDLGFDNKVTRDLTEEELAILRKEVTKYMIEGDLRRYTARRIDRLMKMRCYRGIRHRVGLPCRGQRTKNNCRTLKGKRVTVANKKKAPGPK
ncbi:30S ribosomal protein S13 [Rhynchospora pubera]|uniref:30S ribosomal protein S13 n=1 Tax=Rhynchospora pubera TaxID=906938 RepID=A0AAV8D699_9POAL|nr:30S ribosomal protein S13 [Rhynchospora pubera]KAJ4762721.1 30S ribosomal protein S13 [Rhynchospora pubera]KAJ4791389.1 30S ribosomal protein S13 [Rhynchospora pubera]KAJ4815217.1 30S ribosomal protein S13 [Rhynchospora pubera]